MSQRAPVDAVTRLVSKSSGRLGFGTGLLHHVNDSKSAVSLLRQANDLGVTYFDTARLYGDGRCEGLIGEAFSHMREDVIIATKVGILPTPRDLRTRVQGKAATLLRRLPPLRRVVPEPAPQRPEFGVFDRDRMQRSFETSLQQLRTDHVDLLLLHECTLEDVRRPEVTDFLDQMVREGKARAYGVAPTPEAMRAIAGSGAPYGAVAQFDGGLREGISFAGVSPPALMVTHSCLGDSFRSMLKRLQEDGALKQRWSSALGVDTGDPALVAQAFLAHALHQNSGGIVLFSTTQPDRLRANLEAPAWLSAPDKIAALSQLLAGE